jgi:hypothetical protein
MHDWTNATTFERIGWIANIAEGAGGLLALAAIIISIVTFRRQIETEHYKLIDQMYFNIKAIALQEPAFNDPNAARASPALAAKYEVYAFMVWNFLETVYDSCEDDRSLRETWQPVLAYEAMLHRDWLNRPENRGRYKKQFLEFMNRGGFGGRRHNNALVGPFAT